MKEYIRDLKCFHRKHWRKEITINLAVLCLVVHLLRPTRGGGNTHG